MEDPSAEDRASNDHSNGQRNRPPSPPPIKSSKYSRSPSPRRRPRTPPSREFGRSYDRFDRRRNFSPVRRRNRSRSPEFNRNRRSRSTSRGRRGFSPRGRRRPQTPPVPPPPIPTMNHVPAYVPQPVFGADQYQGYCGYVPQQYNSNTTVGFDPNYMVPNNPYMAPAPNYGGPPPAPVVMNAEYMQQPQQWIAPQQQPTTTTKAQDDAVALEMLQQKETLRKQRDDYDKRRLGLRKELKILKEQRFKLTSGSNGPPSPTTKNFLKDNDKLQSQIEKKMSTIDNVIEMLTNIIGVDAPPGVDPEDAGDGGEKKKRAKRDGKKRNKRSDDENSDHVSSNDDDSEPEKLKTKVIESMKQRSKAKEEVNVPLDQQVNYAFYDPELHWCKSCNVFPKTAKDYLNHLHSKEHTDVLKKSTESPWHENNPNVGMPTYANAPSRRTPIRGLQFFVPATAWYCKLCSTWMGDLHCASLHLKSKRHSESITKFVEHNPDFEVDWISERQKAYEHQGGMASTAAPSATTASLFEGIPLNLNIFGGGGKSRTASESKEPKKSKKKKGSSKKEKKSTKKRAKGSKKRSSKHSGSSSSSSSSSSSDSDSSSSSSNNEEAQRMKVLLSQPSIRNQMRKMEPERPVPPPPPAPSATANNGNERQRSREESSVRGRSAVVDEEQLERERRRRRRSPENDRMRSRSPPNDSRYGRGRNRSRERQYRRRDSRSRSPAYRRSSRRSRSRSRSRSPRRIEKPVVNYPPQFKPRVAEKSKVVEKRRTTPPKKTSSSAGSGPPGKKLPFIGRMPVFKKHGGGSGGASSEEVVTKTSLPEKREGEEQEQVEDEKKKKKKGEEAANDDDTEKTQETVENEVELEQQMEQMPLQTNDDDELMPDPEQLKRLIHDDQERTRQQEQDDMLPPGIDESESHLAPKAINDVPVPRRGPLPKDLEDALNIIFPDEKPEGHGPQRKPFVVTGHIKDNGTEIITGPEPEDEVAQNTAAMYQVFSAYQQQDQGDLLGGGAVPTPPQFTEEGSMSAMGVDGSAEGAVENHLEEQDHQQSQQQYLESEAAIEVPGNNEMDLDELAMLGIDANDLAAQFV